MDYNKRIETEFIGKTVKELQEFIIQNDLEKLGYSIRITSEYIDGYQRNYVITCNYLINRINLSIIDGVIHEIKWG